MGAHFSLNKWYMDCVSEEGDAAIVYCARLRWRGLRLSYAGLLTNLDGAVATDSTLFGHKVEQTDEGIEVDIPRLHLHGVWRADAAPQERVLLAREDGSVRWRCLQPRSQASLDLGARRLTGLGYAERLELTLPPWRLPMRHLRWGRFVSPDEAITWIDWQGPEKIRLLLRNGDEGSLQAVDEERLLGADFSLEFRDSRELRAGRLQNTVARQSPLLRRIFSHSILQVDERKWLSRGALSNGAQGWTIHEAVQWTKE